MSIIVAPLSTNFWINYTNIYDS